MCRPRTGPPAENSRPLLDAIGSLWTILWRDGVVADMSKLAEDQPDGVKGSNIGESFDNAPFAVMRLINAGVISLIGLSQVLAIY